MRRARYGPVSAHDELTIPEFATLLGFASAKDARIWLRRWSTRLGLQTGARTVPRTVLETARGLMTGDSGYHAQARLEAYLKESTHAHP